MKAFALTVLLFFFTLGCSEDPEVKNFKVQISPANPPIIFAARTLNFLVGEEILSVEITGPWMQSGFSVINDNDRTITIISAEFKVTGPDGEVRTAELFNEDDLLDEQSVFGVFKAEGDIDCNGIVDASDATAAPPINCPLDNQNPSFTGELFYVYNLMNGLEAEELDPFRGSSFDFEMRLEGWFGGPEDPQKGFFKVINFTVNSNS